ncbi:MAG: toxic anion resistance protein [Pseudomonadota bacterium]
MSNQSDSSVDQTATTMVGGDLHVAAANLPELKDAMVVYESAAPEERAKIEELMASINLADTNSIIFFGTKAQENLTTVSDNMLEGVKNKDLGAAGDSLSDMVATLRGFDADGLEKPGFFARLFGRAKPIVKFLQRYEDVRKQIDKISNELDSHKTKLLTDITSLDRLYEANLQYFHDLELYIAAGDEKLRLLDEEVIPELDRAAQATDDVIKAQELRDLRSARDDLERRVHDLKLTRQVTMQSLPSIRLVQENDKGLVTKINSTMANTIPLWQTQLATSVTIARSHAAAKSVKAASDLTNELLEENAEALKTANAEVRAQIERGVFDLESVKKANQSLIDTIEESLQIADEGKRRRAEAVVQLQEMENNLKETLAAASARANA